MDLMNLFGKVGNIVADTGKQVGSAVAKTAKEAKDYAKDAMEIANLKTQISTCEDAIKTNYAILGEYYYKNFAEDPAADVVESVRVIKNAEDTMKELEDQIAEIKAAQAVAKEAQSEDDIIVEAEDVTDSVDDELAKVKEDSEDNE